MAEFPQPCLILITDRTLLTPNWTLAQAVAPAVTGGANVVLFREVDLPPTPRMSVARFVLDGIHGRVPMLCSGDPDFAVKVGADGVLVEELEGAESARRAIGPERILGAMVSSFDSFGPAESAGIDFGLLNLDWNSPTSSIDSFKRFREVTKISLVVGVDVPLEVVGPVMEAGADGIAICAVGMAAYNRTEAMREYACLLGLHT